MLLTFQSFKQSSLFENPDSTFFSETVEFPILIVVTGAIAMEQALWTFVVIGEISSALVFGYILYLSEYLKTHWLRQASMGVCVWHIS